MYSNFALVYDSLMESVDRKAWLEYIISLFGDAKIERVADCACGTGALSIPLAKRGYKVTGLDASEEMLRIAAENARAERVNVPFVCQDMRRLALHRPADAVLAVCDGVNYLTLKGAEGFFANAYAALREGGMLLFDISSRYKLSTILGNNTFAEDESAAAYIWKNAYDEQTKQIQMELTLFEKQADGRYVRFNESQIQRAHSQREMEGAMKRAGFERIEAFDAFTFDAPNEKSERIQFRAIKPND